MKRSLTKDLFNRRDFCLEIIIAIFLGLITISLCLVPIKITDIVEKVLIMFLSDNRISLITNIAAIFIGAYINVLLIISTSKLSMALFLLKNKMEQRILGIIIVGILEDFLLILMPFFFCEHYIFSTIYIGIIILSFISFIKFIITSFYIFNINILEMIKEIDEENKYKTEIIVSHEEEMAILTQLRKLSQEKDNF